ncbi:F-box/WD repeat-containing protein pof10 [Paramyrothecium foliicola]|nr:F-box/WD repeat-containing protein pof10 [Paramyrothecium foliicola]
MQQVPIETSEPQPQPVDTSGSASSSQHGLHHQGSSGLYRVESQGSSSSPRSVADATNDSIDGVNADQLDERLRGLSLDKRATGLRVAAGQRVSDYENALTPPTPRQGMGFKVIKRPDSASSGVQLTEFPNEILTHILSHLHPDSHAAVALVSKRFYALVTTPHAWRMAFLRYFPGHSALVTKSTKRSAELWPDANADLVRSETRYFGRLTSLATWRSEYLFRTRLIRSLARGKPGTSSGHIGSSVRNAQTGKKVSAVLTYNSKLPWLVTNIHAIFDNGKKPPRAIQGAADLGVATISDPTSGKIEKWGFEDPFNSLQLDEVMPHLVPFGLGDGPAATPNVMDVSQPYGILNGEGFPGGRAFFRSINELRGRYLGGNSGVVDTYPDIPKIPEMAEAISSVWIAKSSAVPTTTKSMVGMLTGSTLGVVTAYSLGTESNASRFSNGDMTARWILSPGVPIISLKVDDQYNLKRKASARVWAVALNALGEVFYMTDVPTDLSGEIKGEDMTKNAWYAARTACWHLLESTRRLARQDDLDKNALRGGYSPRSPSNSMTLSKEQLAAEAREIEKFLRHKPAHFRRVCEGWDMQRKLEVDFASDDGHGAGERIFVIDCGLAENVPPRLSRYSRVIGFKETGATSLSIDEESLKPHPSLFGDVGIVLPVKVQTPEVQLPRSPPPTPMTPVNVATAAHDWKSTNLDLKPHHQVTISATTLDCSTNSLLTLAEDPLHSPTDAALSAAASRVDQSAREIPGRRTRFLAIGTKSGAIVVWNARDEETTVDLQPVRIIQTESPEISCLAVTALYLVHGGSDGLVQAWDPLASTLDPIRTLNARSNGRVPRHMTTMNPTLREGTYTAVGAIFLDPDPSTLRGIVSFGAFLRYWSYSSKGQSSGRKRRVRHSDVHGRLASRRLGGTVAGYIAAEERELRRENEQRAKEQTRLRNRFGVGALGDLTEEEAVRYAQMISEEAFQQDEQRRASTSDSAADASLDTASSFSETSADTVTPEPSVVDQSTAQPPPNLAAEDEYEQQIQQAIRLSLLEGVNDAGQSPRGQSSGEYEFSVSYKAKSSKKSKNSGSTSPFGGYTPANGSSSGPSRSITNEDEALAIALSLSMQEQARSVADAAEYDSGPATSPPDEFPPLNTEGVGKGKGIRRW